MFVDWKNKYSKNNYTVQDNLQIQCHLYQITNGVFQRSRTKNLTTCLETQKSSSSYSNNEREEKKMELEESGSLILDYITKLQS